MRTEAENFFIQNISHLNQEKGLHITRPENLNDLYTKFSNALLKKYPNELEIPGEYYNKKADEEGLSYILDFVFKRAGESQAKTFINANSSEVEVLNNHFKQLQISRDSTPKSPEVQPQNSEENLALKFGTLHQSMQNLSYNDISTVSANATQYKASIAGAGDQFTISTPASTVDLEKDKENVSENEKTTRTRLK